jgi:hypothetical protein
MEKLILGLLPGIMLMIKRLPMATKLTYADYIGDLCIAYTGDQRKTFEWLLTKDTAFPPAIHTAIVEALWTGPNPITETMSSENQAER